MKSKKSMLNRMSEIDHQSDIPHFVLWLRKTRGISQRDLAKLTGLEPSQITQIEKSRTVFPYRTLKPIYHILKEHERVFFLECVKGHVETLLESYDDEDFKEHVKVKGNLSES